MLSHHWSRQVGALSFLFVVKVMTWEKQIWFGMKNAQLGWQHQSLIRDIRHSTLSRHWRTCPPLTFIFSAFFPGQLFESLYCNWELGCLKIFPVCLALMLIAFRQFKSWIGNSNRFIREWRRVDKLRVVCSHPWQKRLWGFIKEKSVLPDVSSFASLKS